MNCFPCCVPKKSLSKREHGSPPPEPVTTKAPDMKKRDEPINVDPADIKAHSYTFRELATATKNFRQECLMGEGGYGRIYKGIIPATGKVVAVKQLDRNGMQSSKEFLAEVAELSQLHHENLVNLIGYCADGDQRLLVYELFAGRTLEDRLFENKAGEGPLNWFDRMKIVAAASKGLEYLHETANPPVIFRDLKASNILVDTDLEAKLCDFGLTKISNGDKSAPPRLMGTYGYCAPEYAKSGQLTMKSDVYSFGVILLELITGRRAIDTTRPNEEQNLVSWATPLFRDPKKYPDMADPVLNKNFPEKDLNQVVAMASMCLQEEPEARPLISDVVTALSFLSAPPPVIPPVTPPVTTASKSKKSSASESKRESEYGSEYESESESESESDSDSGSEVSGTMSHRSSVSESQHDSDSQLLPAISAKASRKSSTRSKKETHHSDSGDGNVSSDHRTSRKISHKVSKKTSEKELGHKSSKKTSEKELGHKSSKKSSEKELGHKSSKKTSEKELDHKISKKTSEKELNHKSSKKSSEKELGHRSSKKVTSEEDVTEKSSKNSSVKDLSQKSSRKSSIKNLYQKSSRKSSSRILSHKSSKASEEGSYSSSCRSSSVASEDEEAYSERSSMSLSQGGISFGLISSESAHSDHNSSRRSGNESIHYGSRSSIGSDVGSVHSP